MLSFKRKCAKFIEAYYSANRETPHTHVCGTARWVHCKPKIIEMQETEQRKIKISQRQLWWALSCPQYATVSPSPFAIRITQLFQHRDLYFVGALAGTLYDCSFEFILAWVRANGSIEHTLAFRTRSTPMPKWRDAQRNFTIIKLTSFACLCGEDTNIGASVGPMHKSTQTRPTGRTRPMWRTTERMFDTEHKQCSWMNYISFHFIPNCGEEGLGAHRL